MISTPDDRARMLAFADELDAQADALDEAETIAAFVIVRSPNDEESNG